MWRLCSTAILARVFSVFMNDSQARKQSSIRDILRVWGFCYSRVSSLLMTALLSLGNGMEYRMGEPTAREPGSTSVMERLQGRVRG